MSHSFGLRDVHSGVATTTRIDAVPYETEPTSVARRTRLHGDKSQLHGFDVRYSHKALSGTASMASTIAERDVCRRTAAWKEEFLN